MAGSVGGCRARRARRGCGSCTARNSNDAKLHLAAAPEDLKALGIGKEEIEVREDGRRTPQSSDYFEWWYFDGLFDDGTVFRGLVR